MKRVAISIGDINGIGLEIALRAHNVIKKRCKPLYFVDENIVESARKMLMLGKMRDFEISEVGKYCKAESAPKITPGKIAKDSGEYSFVSFKRAIKCVENGGADALLTLPIHKKAWEMAGVKCVGHTDYLSRHFKRKGIMMLGCERLFVALFTDHIALKNVPKCVKKGALVRFLIDFHTHFGFENALVLGLNPHAGDNGVLGKEDFAINKAINKANNILGKNAYIGAMSPDVAFSARNRERFRVFVAMYHDQGLCALKALYFDESINITLGLPILRVSTDHGVAFDIAYRKEASLKSYLNAVDFIIKNGSERLFGENYQRLEGHE